MIARRKESVQLVEPAASSAADTAREATAADAPAAPLSADGASEASDSTVTVAPKAQPREVIIPMKIWPEQAVVIGQDDLHDLYGPVIGGLLDAADCWLKASPFFSVLSLFVACRAKQRRAARKRTSKG